MVDISKMRGQHRVHFISQVDTIKRMLGQGYSQKAIWASLSESHDWTMSYRTFGHYIQKFNVSENVNIAPRLNKKTNEPQKYDLAADPLMRKFEYSAQADELEDLV